MRINFFVGLWPTLHFVRKILTGDPRISTPVMPLTKIGKGLYGNAIQRVGFDDVVKSIMWNDTTAQECNIGVQNFAEDAKQNVIMKWYKPYAPRGSRFYFFKHKDIDYVINDHYTFLEPYSRDRYLIKHYNFGKYPLDKDHLYEIFIHSYKELDKMADIVGAGEWHDFDLKDYFEDGVSKPTDMQVRLYTLD